MDLLSPFNHSAAVAAVDTSVPSTILCNSIGSTQSCVHLKLPHIVSWTAKLLDMSKSFEVWQDFLKSNTTPRFRVYNQSFLRHLTAWDLLFETIVQSTVHSWCLNYCSKLLSKQLLYTKYNAEHYFLIVKFDDTQHWQVQPATHSTHKDKKSVYHLHTIHATHLAYTASVFHTRELSPSYFTKD